METKAGTTTTFYFHKWTTFAAMYVGYTLIVLDRKSFSFALPAIMNDLHLDKDDLGKPINLAPIVLMKFEFL
jgi:sugar phosphate permease